MTHEVRYAERSLQEVLNFFADAYQPTNPAERIVSYESFVDVTKGKVIFKIVLDRTEQ